MQILTMLSMMCGVSADAGNVSTTLLTSFTMGNGTVTGDDVALYEYDCPLCGILPFFWVAVGLFLLAAVGCKWWSRTACAENALLKHAADTSFLHRALMLADGRIVPEARRVDGARVPRISHEKLRRHRRGRTSSLIFVLCMYWLPLVTAVAAEMGWICEYANLGTIAGGVFNCQWIWDSSVAVVNSMACGMGSMSWNDLEFILITSMIAASSCLLGIANRTRARYSWSANRTGDTASYDDFSSKLGSILRGGGSASNVSRGQAQHTATVRDLGALLSARGIGDNSGSGNGSWTLSKSQRKKQKKKSKRADQLVQELATVHTKAANGRSTGNIMGALKGILAKYGSPNGGSPGSPGSSPSSPGSTGSGRGSSGTSSRGKGTGSSSSSSSSSNTSSSGKTSGGRTSSSGKGKGSSDGSVRSKLFDLVSLADDHWEGQTCELKDLEEKMAAAAGGTTVVCGLVDKVPTCIRSRKADLNVVLVALTRLSDASTETRGPAVDKMESQRITKLFTTTFGQQPVAAIKWQPTLMSNGFAKSEDTTVLRMHVFKKSFGRATTTSIARSTAYRNSSVREFRHG